MWSGRRDLELRAGDLLLISSRRLDIPEETVAHLARTALQDQLPLDSLARTLERRAAAAFDESEAHRATDVAFVLALARPAEG